MHVTKCHFGDFSESAAIPQKWLTGFFFLFCIQTIAHRDAFCQFHFRWIYYRHSSKSTGKETDKNAPLCIVRSSWSLGHSDPDPSSV